MSSTLLTDPRFKRVESNLSNTTTNMIQSPVVLSLPFTGNTPEVILDKRTGTAFILGRCLCSNPLDFFKPLVQWAEDYIQHPQQVTVVTINTDYINTGSTMAIRQFLGILTQVQFTGRRIIIKWYCDKDDTDTREMITMVEEIIKTKISIELP